MEVYSHEQREQLIYVHTIRLENNAGEWEFAQNSEPFPFEKTQRYLADNVPANDRSATFVKIRTKNQTQNKDISLQEARRLNGIEN